MKPHSPIELSIVDCIATCEVVDKLVINVDGALALGYRLLPLELTASSSERIESVSAGLSEMIRRLPDGTILQLIVDVGEDPPPSVTDYVAHCDRQGSGESAENTLAIDVACHVRRLAFRNVGCWLFVCQPYAFQSASMVRAGALPTPFPAWSRAGYDRALRALEHTAFSVRDAFNAAGMSCRDADEAELLALMQRVLNPRRSLAPIAAGRSHDPDDGPFGVRDLDPSYTLRERLACTDFAMPEPSFVVAGDVGIRVLSLKDLPETTAPAMLGSLFFGLGAPYRLSLSIEKLPAERALAGLKVRRSVANGIAALSARRNIDAEVQHGEIEALMQALSQSALSLCAVQLTCSLFGRTREDLYERTELATQVFARAGGISALVEDYNHLDAYLSQLPGAAHRFRRTKTVTDLNAGHMLVPFGAWHGSRTGLLLLRGRAGDAIVFDPFSDELPAFNGLVIGGSGSGKSFFTNLMLANHLALGGGAVVVDIGGSYRRLTEIFGGTYLDVGRVDSVGLNPLPSPAELSDASDEVREQKLQFIAGFLELLLSESKGGMPNSERAIIAKALSAFYSRDSARARSQTPTSLADIQAFLAEYEELEREAALRLARRFDLWVRGPRARLFAKRIDLDMRPSIVAIDLKSVEGDPDLQAVALYVLSFVIWAKLADARGPKRNTMVVFDECWALLSNAPAARLIENLVRTARKYGAGLWCLSQSVDDFANATIGPALLSNSFNRVLLRHAFGHERVAELCALTDHGLAAFRTLTYVKGRFSEAFLQSGNHAELVQITPSPLAYWMATTNAADKALEQSTREKNRTTAPTKILAALAKRFPMGAVS